MAAVVLTDGNRRMIVVIDNLDRVNSEDALAIWATLRRQAGQGPGIPLVRFGFPHQLQTHFLRRTDPYLLRHMQQSLPHDPRVTSRF